MKLDSRTLARLAIGLAAGFVLFPRTVRADPQRPCQDDLKRLCADAKPGPDTRKCLVDNMDKLSEGCKQRISAVRDRRQAYPARFRDCEGDLQKFCKDTAPGGGRLVKCLHDHESELTAQCKSRLPGEHERAGTGGRGNGSGHGDGGGHGDGSGSGKAAATGGGNQPNATAAQGKATTDSK